MSSVTYLQMCVGPFPHNLTSSRWWLGIRLSELLCAVLCTAVGYSCELSLDSWRLQSGCYVLHLLPSAKEIIFSICLFVCLLAKPLNRFLQNSVKMWQMGHGKIRQIFCGYLDHVNVMIGLGLGLTFHVTPGRSVLPLGEGHKTGLVVPSVV